MIKYRKTTKYKKKTKNVKMKKNHKTKKIVYTTGHGLMLPIMVEIPGGRIIYPNGITQTGFTTRYCYDGQFALLTLNFKYNQFI